MDEIKFRWKRWFQSASSRRLVLVLGTQPVPLPFIRGAAKIGAVMWTSLLALSAAIVVLTAIVVVGLFRLAALKRPDDLKAPSRADDWVSSHELQTPK
jgi:hypothetical protein